MKSSSHAFAFSTRALLMAILAATINIGGVVMLFGSSTSANAAPVADLPSPSDCPLPTAVQRRILAAASNGIAALRRYVWRTRGIHQFDLVEVVQWIDGYRLASMRCENRGSAAADSETQADERPEPDVL